MKVIIILSSFCSDESNMYNLKFDSSYITISLTHRVILLGKFIIHICDILNNLVP